MDPKSLPMAFLLILCPLALESRDGGGSEESGGGCKLELRNRWSISVCWSLSSEAPVPDADGGQTQVLTMRFQDRGGDGPPDYQVDTQLFQIILSSNSRRNLVPC